MKYERFEDLPVWKSAAGLASNMFRWSSQPEFRGKGDLSNQLQRATLSISNNIAEGFERGTTAELITFLYYARGSAGEVRSMLAILDQMSEFDRLKPHISEIRSECESISRQIRAWTNSLQNSDITGQRHLNDQTRQDYDRRKRQQAFLDRQREFMLKQEAQWKQAAEQRNRESEVSDDGTSQIWDLKFQILKRLASMAGFNLQTPLAQANNLANWNRASISASTTFLLAAHSRQVETYPTS